MAGNRLKSLAVAAGLWTVVAGTVLQPCVYAAGETENAVESVWETIPEAEIENGPAEDEVTNENTRSAGLDDADEQAVTEMAETGSTEDNEAEAGQPGYTVYSAGEMDRTGDAVAVTFRMDVPEDMTYPCIVTFTESESYTEYYVEAYKTAGYVTTAYLEPGTYLITDGYPTNDNVSAYSVVDKTYFTVEKDSDSMTVNVVIRSKGDIIRGDTGNTVTGVEEAAAETVTQTGTEQKKDYTMLYIMAAVIFMTLGIFIGVVGIRYFDKAEK